MESETFEPLKCACCFLLLFLPDAHDRVMGGLLVSCWDEVQHTGSNVALNLWHASFPLLNLSLGRFFDRNVTNISKQVQTLLIIEIR